MAVDLGQLYRATYEVRDANGALTNATVSLAVTLPDGTTAAPGSPFTPVNDSTGVYHVDFATATVGLHKFAWTSTSPTTSKVDWVEVRQFISLISFADGKLHLNEQGSLQDEEIRSFMETATEVVESIVGPCIIRTFTDRVRTGGGQLLLPRFPVVSVTSVTSVRTPSTTYLTAELDVDLDAGVVSLNTGWGFTDGPWNVVYKAGRSIIPARYVQADKEMLWHLWTTQRGALADSTTPDLLDVAQFESPLGVGFAIPNRVMELLGADRTPGFA
jgi:hypothetical protein